MWNIGTGEFIAIAIFALLIFGPKRLPEIGRNVGRALAQVRKATSELKEGFDLGFDEEPLFLTGPTKPTRPVAPPARAQAPPTPGSAPSVPPAPDAGPPPTQQPEASGGSEDGPGVR
jgi:TatA/E family protein of Tat protein translocase